MKLQQFLFLAFCLLLPFAFNLHNADSPFELFKFLFSGVYLSVLAIVFLIGVFKNRITQFKMSVATVLIFLIAVSNLISYLFSINPYLSMWGDNLLPADSLASVLYFVAAAFIGEQLFKDNPSRVAAVLISALLVQLCYGLLQAFGYDFYSWNYAKPVFGTFGSTVSFSTYIGCLVPVAICYFFASERFLIKAFLFVVIVVSNFLLIETASRTPAAVNILIEILLLVYFFRKREVFKSSRSVPVMLIAIVCVYSLAFFKPAEKETLKFKFDSQQVAKGFETRKLLWQDAFSAWREHPFFGFGPETFSVAHRYHHSTEMNQFKRWHSAWIKAHNHLVQYLVTLGVVGVLTHLLLFGFVLRGLIKSWFSEVASADVRMVAFGSGFVFLFAANLTAFNFITTEFFYFLFPALAFSSQTSKTLNFEKLKNAYRLLLAAFISLFLLLCFKCVNHFRGDILYQLSYLSLNRHQDLQISLLLAEEAIKTNPQEPAYHCHMSQIETRMLVEGKNISAEVKGYILDGMNKETELCKATAVNRDHYFLQVANQYGELFTKGIIETPEKSLENYETLMTLAPNVPLAYYRSALIYFKAGNFVAFEENMEKALELKSNYLPAYLELLQYYYSSQSTEKKYQLLERLANLKQQPTEMPELLKDMAQLAEKNGDKQASDIILKKYESFSIAK